MIMIPKTRPPIAHLVKHVDGSETVQIGTLSIPVIGYLNCTGKPLPEDAANAAAIRSFLDRPVQPKPCQSESRFFGLTYIYPTPNDGPREIGVTRGMGDTWIVAWVKDSGATRRVKTHNLPVSTDPKALQNMLDSWACSRDLDVVARVSVGDGT